jgi:Zn-dependent protease
MTTTRTPDQAPGGTDPGRDGRGGAGDRGRGGGRGLRIAGLTVRLTAGGYLLPALALVISALSLPAAVPGLPATAYLAAGVAVAIVLLASVVLHEVGHALAARRHGVRVEEISVGFLGGTTHGGYDLPGPKGQWRVAAAGPAVSLVLAAVAAGGAVGLSALGTGRLAVLVVISAAFVNAIFGVLSLLPGAGPDGGRIVRALTWARTGDPAKAGIVAARAGQATGALLAAAGIAAIAAGYFGGLWLGLIGVLAFVTSRSQARQQLASAALAGLRVRDVVALSTSPQAGAQSWQTVRAFVDAHNEVGTPADGGLRGPVAAAFPLSDFDGRPSGLLTLSQIAVVPAERQDDVRLRDIATPIAHVVTTTGDEPLTALMQRLSVWPRLPAAVHTAGHALVLGADGAIAGVLTPADLARASQLAPLRRARQQRADSHPDPDPATSGSGTSGTGTTGSAVSPPRLWAR